MRSVVKFVIWLLALLLVTGCGSNAQPVGLRPSPPPFPTATSTPQGVPSSGAGTTLITYSTQDPHDPSDYEPVLALAWSSDSRQVAYVSANTTVVLDAATGTSLRTDNIGDGFAIYTVAWSPDGKYIAAGDGGLGGGHGQPITGQGTVQIWNAATGSPLLSYHGHVSRITTVAWSPDGQEIASGSADKTVQVWNAFTGRLLLTYRGHADVVTSVAWSPDGKEIASASQDKTIQVWNATTGHLLTTYHGHTSIVNAVAWSPTGQYICSAGDDQTAQVWDAATGQTIFTYRGHASIVYAVAWSPDGQLIASASDDKTVQVWGATNGVLLLTYRGHSAAVRAVAWSPDGTRIASGGDDMTVQIWQAPK